MRKAITDKLLDQLNAKRGRGYPEIGYLYFANVTGDGRNYRSIYEIINANGGVSYSQFNATSDRKRCEKIRAELQKS